MNKKQLTAKVVNAAISGVRFGFGTTATITKAFFDMANDMADNIAGVSFPNRVSDAIWGCGQNAVTGAMNVVQKGVEYWGEH